MTIGGWIVFGFLAAIILVGAISIGDDNDKVFPFIIAALVIIGLLFGGMWWYYHGTASGSRALTDQKSELGNGLERTITVYTADGEIIAQYEGKIDIEGNDGGYVLFDYNGHRYTYYNCFVESIAEID